MSQAGLCSRHLPALKRRLRRRRRSRFTAQADELESATWRGSRCGSTFGPGRAIGHGKVRLLEAVRDHGSISAAGRSMGMSYRRAWLLLDELNHIFEEPVIDAKHGGSG